jgi:hypothetical protein
MTPLLDSRIITIYDPTTRPVSFVALEVVTLVLAGLTLWHALRARRAGDRAALLTWITIVVYGLVMEILSYNLFQNFSHGQFTVMFYDRQLPLYVTAVYWVLQYTGITTARRLGLPRWAEAFAAGALIVAMDVPFDIVGPPAGWWTWFDTDPNIAYRWLGVPVTSLYWHMAFGGILAYVTAAAAARSKRPRGPSLLWAGPLSLAVVLLGVLSFAPFHALKALGIADGVTVAAALAACVAIAVAVRRRDRLSGASAARHDRTIPATWLVWYGLHAAVAASLAAADITGWGRRLGFIALVALVALAVSFASGQRRPPLTGQPVQ